LVSAHCTTNCCSPAALLLQAFSIGLYLTGLIGFAVLLALVEQSVLQVLPSSALLLLPSKEWLVGM
jgi:hypothetical protein